MISSTLLLIGVILAAIYHYKRQLPYFIKWFTYTALILLIATIAIPIFVIVGPGKSTNLLFVIPILQMISKLLGIQWDIQGKEHIASVHGPCVIICNHQTALDFLCMCELWPIWHKCVGVAKKGLFWLIPFGPAAHMVGTVFIDRHQASSAKSTLADVGQNMKIEGNKVFIFPEGTRNRQGNPEFLPFKKGAFHIALENRVPLCPMVIGPYHFVSDEKRLFGKGKVRVTILPAIDTTKYELTDVSELSNTAREMMSLEYSKLSNAAKTYS